MAELRSHACSVPAEATYRSILPKLAEPVSAKGRAVEVINNLPAMFENFRKDVERHSHGETNHPQVFGKGSVVMA